MSDEYRNVVLVSIDSLRADHCGFLGDDRGLTPEMDTLAAKSINFQNAVTPGPQTFSAMPAVFTGVRRAPGDLDRVAGDVHWQRRIAAIETHLETHGTLAERFSEMGYTTVGISPNPWASSASGFDRGFDHFKDMVGKTSDGWLRTAARRVPFLDETSKPIELTLDLLTGSSFFTQWEDVYGEVEAMRDSLTEPYFLWIFLLDTHYPFLPSRADRVEQTFLGMLRSTVRSEKAMRGHTDTMPNSVRESVQRNYRDTVRSVDRCIGRLWDDFRDDDPVIILHSDHGESFGEHGNYGHHHRELYEENVHVPYLAYTGDQQAIVTEPVSLASIPDVALMAGQGERIDIDRVTAPAVVSASEGGTNWAVRDRQFKYLEQGTERSLFALMDGTEQTDVSHLYPEHADDLQDLLLRSKRHRDESDNLARAARLLAGDKEP